MSSGENLPFEITLEVRDSCLCLHLQRAARAVARRFDRAFRPLDLTSGQFSLLMSLNRPEPASIGNVSTLLAMDRTTLTANLKPLERRGLVAVAVDPADKRTRRLTLTPAGRALLAAAVPIWQATHAAVERAVPGADPDRLRTDLVALSAPNFDGYGGAPSGSPWGLTAALLDKMPQGS
jgi:DNA-binding MarR family transcriptional regulator